MASRKRHRIHATEGDLGFQIAPMVDVVFVIMLFFMVLAGNRQVETELKMKLPTTEVTDTTTDTPMEEQVAIDDLGGITHNEEPVTEDELRSTFSRLKQQSEAEGGTEIIVTITTSPDTKWAHVATVMSAMHFARIQNVTFSVEEE